MKNLGPFLPRQVLIIIISEPAVQSLIHYLCQVCDDASLQADSNLLRQFVETNDHRAFEILLARHGPMVLGSARRLVNESADADDVFQAVFLSLVRIFRPGTGMALGQADPKDRTRSRSPSEIGHFS